MLGGAIFGNIYLRVDDSVGLDQYSYNDVAILA